ncbi:oligodendrocyte-myelin glycoprotein-like [Myripristis murdjan]|uniref:oligodendrocyte-myelin glycoprotein-like n=1 Tax=Myripristis murdjan TaxID=586833 RepID=UPI001175F9E1|nr:oligodendrocyte-myelin glycoprotein-like [Myripristis murdjan]
MRSWHALLKPFHNEVLLELLLVLLLGTHVLAVCPSVCSCSASHREVDCSWRGLRQLPDGLQHNLRSLNLSHNRFHNLDGQLTEYVHLRILDLSHNRLGQLPSGLPRSLWQLYAGANRIRLLDKNDTAYQWNLQLLELSNNKLERAVFINNTLINLHMLNLSHNRFWTVPTNMPMNLETIDLSHNLLVRVLPGSLDRLTQLTHFYLHANRFSTLPFGVFDQMAGLKLITLGHNPWACHLHTNITYLLSWIQQTPARVLGCPCHTQAICGGVRPGRTGGWHFASYNAPPLAASTQDLSVSALLSTQYTTRESMNTQQQPSTASPRGLSTDQHPSSSPAVTDHMLLTDSHIITGTALVKHKAPPTDSFRYDTSSSADTSFVTDTPIATETALATDRSFSTESASVTTKKTTTLRTRSVRRPNQSLPGGVRNISPALSSCSFLPLIYNLWPLILQQVL